MTISRAIGYLRQDISGTRGEWDKARMRRLAERFGYDLTKILAFGPEVDCPIHRVHVAVARIEAEAVFTPSIEHFDGGEVPADLVQVADVITVADEHTYARYSTGQMPEFHGA
ncbi:hypothetical protein AB0N05_37515 [Nocardia sp. NPDC051030]|uniref:hypothetical protein n=1 Tax=Nocardia sp. NPDC051030 TaxID=3155162 RepID=UPI0034166312